MSTEFDWYLIRNYVANERVFEILEVCSFLDPRYKKLEFLNDNQKNIVLTRI